MSLRADSIRCETHDAQRIIAPSQWTTSWHYFLQSRTTGRQGRHSNGRAQRHCREYLHDGQQSDWGAGATKGGTSGGRTGSGAAAGASSGSTTGGAASDTGAGSDTGKWRHS
jgi:hypothetical protein